MTATKNYVCRFYVNVVFELKDNVNDNNKFGISYELTPFMATKLKCTDSSHNLPKHFINYYNMSEYIQNYDDYNQLYGYISLHNEFRVQWCCFTYLDECCASVGVIIFLAPSQKNKS